MKLKWQASLSEYLQRRESLKAVVLLMDIRHPLKDTDVQMLEWATNNDLKVLILLTKCDKLNPGPRKNAVLEVKKATSAFQDVIVEPFSSLKGIGVDVVTRILSDWYQEDELIEPEAE